MHVRVTYLFVKNISNTFDISRTKEIKCRDDHCGNLKKLLHFFACYNMLCGTEKYCGLAQNLKKVANCLDVDKSRSCKYALKKPKKLTSWLSCTWLQSRTNRRSPYFSSFVQLCKWASLSRRLLRSRHILRLRWHGNVTLHFYFFLLFKTILPRLKLVINWTPFRVRILRILKVLTESRDF